MAQLRVAADNSCMPAIDHVLGRPEPTRHADVDPPPNPGVVIYWRDGCPFTARLRFAVRHHRDRAAWVNIWEDPDGAAFVRTTNAGGHETVPTVLIDGIAHTNPDPRLVLEALRRAPLE
ncbi:glutaredoxin domain-containing protein [Nocardioides renjunii]|uniref:glutaredoxin domain-containing protein n=1 Tax=Nocardioides renjunii TaxID=3095075 RepID=UPI00386207DB